MAHLCERHNIRRLALFGSQLKGTARPNSDIDLLVEFFPGARTASVIIRPTLLDGRALVRSWSAQWTLRALSLRVRRADHGPGNRRTGRDYDQGRASDSLGTIHREGTLCMPL